MTLGDNRPQQAYSDRLCLSSAAQEAPNAVALVLNGRELSFADLWERTEPWLTQLPESTIALSARPQLEELLVLYACLELGRTTLLLHPRWTESERQRVLAQVAEVALYQATGFQLLESDSGTVPEIGDQFLLSTSGTTGPPKLVPLSRMNLRAAVESHALNLPFEKADRWLLALPFAHIGGLSILLRSLWARTTVVIAQPSQETLGEQIERNKISLLSVVPTQLRGLLSEVPRLRGVRAILVGGAKVVPSLREEGRRERAPCSLHVWDDRGRLPGLFSIPDEVRSRDFWVRGKAFEWPGNSNFVGRPHRAERTPGLSWLLGRPGTTRALGVALVRDERLRRDPTRRQPGGCRENRRPDHHWR